MNSPGGSTRYVKPSRGPEPSSDAEESAWADMVNTSLPAVRSSAQTWRNGLTGLITLVITGVVIKGRDTTAELSPGWRLAVTLAISGGLLAACAGLWLALAAEAGTRTRLKTLDQIHQKFASVAAYRVSLANTAGQRLQAARWAVGASLVLLLIGIWLTWWAPSAPLMPPAYLRVSYVGGASCGILTSAGGGVLRLAVSGAHYPAVIPLSTVTNIAVVAAC